MTMERYGPFIYGPFIYVSPDLWSDVEVSESSDCEFLGKGRNEGHRHRVPSYLSYTSTILTVPSEHDCMT
jgi:hypothetical protein